MCNSPLITDIDRRLSEGYYAVKQQGELMRTRNEDIRERFIVWATDLFQLKDLRVFVVTTTGSPASGYNKRQYAEEVWNIYTTLTSRVVSSAIAEALDENLDENLETVVEANLEENLETVVNLEEEVVEEITWSIDRTPRRHSDVEMMPLPSIRASRSERIRERRARDLLTYIPSPEFVTFVRNIMQEIDAEADFIPFHNDNEGSKKYNITVTLLAQVSAQVSDVCECCICMNDEINCVDSVKLNCEHQFCGDCIISTLKKHNKSSELKPSCALCRSTMTQIVTNNSDILAKIQEFCV